MLMWKTTTYSIKMWDEAKEPYVLPKHCNQVFFYPDVLDRDWWFRLTHDPRSKHIFEKNSVIMPCELEDDKGEHENREWYGTCVISSIFILFKMGFLKHYNTYFELIGNFHCVNVKINISLDNLQLCWSQKQRRIV